MGGKRKPQIRKCYGKASKGAKKMAVKGKVAKKKGVTKYPASQIALSPAVTQMSEISGATIDTWPQDGDSVGATTATDDTDTVPLDKVEEMIQNDIAENSDGGDSDAGGYGYNIMEDFMEARRNVEIDWLTSDFNEIETNVLDDTENCTMSVSTKNMTLPTYLKNAPKGWSAPSAPGGWTPVTRKEAKGEPKFEDVDNPGQWSEFTFRPNFEGKYGSGAYDHHAAPAGAKVVQLDPMTGKKTVNEFDFLRWLEA